MSSKGEDLREAATLPKGISEDDAASRFAGLLSEEFGDQEEDETSQGEDSPDKETADEDADETTEDEESEKDEPESEDSEESEEPDEESEEQQEEPKLYTVKVDGKELKVTLEELQKGYSRTEDYTRKTQTVAELRKAAEAEAGQYREQRGQYAQMLEQMSGALQEISAQEPDWEKVAQTNPQGLPLLMARWQRHKERVASVESERARVAAEEHQERTAQQTAFLREQREKLLEAVPTWKDATVRRQEQTELIKFAQEIGYTEQEITQVVDHRAVLMLRRAYEGHKLSQKRPAAKAKIEKIKAATPGASTTKVNSNMKTVQRARAKLARTGSVDAAADLFLKAGMAE